jgi:hypothetical protein
MREQSHLDVGLAHRLCRTAELRSAAGLIDSSAPLQSVAMIEQSIAAAITERNSPLVRSRLAAPSAGSAGSA